MQSTKKRFFYLFIFFIFLTLIGFRDFLYTFKLMLFQSYNHNMLPFDEYYKIILYLDTGLEKYNIQCCAGYVSHGKKNGNKDFKRK